MSKKYPSGILAVFSYLDDLTNAMEKIHDRGDFDNHEVFSPTSYHEIEHAGNFGSSAVKWFTLSGCLTGTTLGFVLPLFTDYDWGLVVGGKTPGFTSLPAYVVIGFELTILLGAIMTIIGMLVMCKIPNPGQRILDNRLTDDKFGIFVPNVGADSEQAKFLKASGAEEINLVEAT